MAHDHDTPSKLEIGTHAILPLMLMLFIQMFANYYGSPANTIFLSPYLLAFFVLNAIALVVLWKGQICPGQKGRLTAILPYLLLFALGNLTYTLAFTPKHAPLLIANGVALILPCLYWKFPDEEGLARILAQCGLAMAAIGSLAYLLVFWIELPSLLNWVRANNFAQLLAGLLLGGWYLMLAKSRLEGLLKLLAKAAVVVLLLNYLWVMGMLYLQAQQAGVVLLPYLLFFILQFVILALLAWLLLGKQGKNIKNPAAWTTAMLLGLSYPLINVI